MNEMNRMDELKSKLAEIIKKKSDTRVQMILDNRIGEINYAILREELEDAFDALEYAILENDDKIKSVHSQTTSGSIYKALHKYIHGVEPEWLSEIQKQEKPSTNLNSL